MAGTRDFLGTGWAFPPRADEATGRMQTSSEEENIRQSVRIILSTRCILSSMAALIDRVSSMLSR